MILARATFLFLCFYLLAPLLYNTSVAALSSSGLQVINCSTSGNYSASSAYEANVNQFLAALPENTVSKNGGFFNGTVGLGPDTVYGLAMCPADYSRGDCRDCLAGAAASSADGLPNLCPGSTTVLAMFERCLIRYSNVNFFGTPEIGIVNALSGQTVFTSTTGLYGPKVAQSFKDRTAEALVSPQRFSASATDPYTFVQCTWDLSAGKCKECLDVLSDNASNVNAIRMDGLRKSYSCTVRYSNTSFMVVPFTAASGPTPQSVDQMGTSAPPPASSGPKAAIVGGGVVAVLGVISLAACIWYVFKLRRQRNTKDVQRFTYRQLAKATSQFAQEERLGAGSFGTVYKGKVKGIRKHEYVAVKMITIPVPEVTASQSQQQVRKDLEDKKKLVMTDFDNEIRVMSPLHHRNIISLVGWCKENDSLFLVYELMENGNLEDQLYPRAAAMDSDLHGVTAPGYGLLLDWPKRNSILIGIATGLVYLHCECGERLLHRDIKPSNVMLDKTFNAKLCDFGLVTQFSHNSTHHSTDNIRGSRGYVDPAYAESGRSCEQNDIYSFGIVLLEVVCCQKPTVTQVGDSMRNHLVEMVRRFHYQENGGILGAADTRLRGLQYDEQLRRVLMIGLSCVQPDRNKRPHIRVVLACLTGQNTTLPSLPTQNYILPTVNESGPTASTSDWSNATEDYSTCSNVPFLSGQ